MTEDLKCEMCQRPAVGVFSTSVPYSAAYCLECANMGADPEWIFNFWAEDIGSPDKLREPDLRYTYKNGKYINYTQWWAERTNNEGGDVSPPCN